MSTASLFTEAAYPTGSAVFSPDRRYRYVLTRQWSEDASTHALFVGLNPSVATEEANDPTIRREIDFAKRLGHGALVKVNLFGLVSTDSLGLVQVKDPNGPENDHHLFEQASRVNATVIVCWGSHKRTKEQAVLVRKRAEFVLDEFLHRGIGLFCLGVNSDSQPKHPLYLKAETQLRVYGGLS